MTLPVRCACTHEWLVPDDVQMFDQVTCPACGQAWTKSSGRVEYESAKRKREWAEELRNV